MVESKEESGTQGEGDKSKLKVFFSIFRGIRADDG